MKTITVTNQKGGTGKTSAALALTAWLTQHGRRVLLLDMDAQANATYISGEQRREPDISDVLDGAPIASVVRKTEAGYDIVTASPDLAGADIFISGPNKATRIRDALEECKGAYDVTIIDTPPHLGILTTNAIAAADVLILPAQADALSYIGISDLRETVEPIRAALNPTLHIGGILLTRYSARNVLSRDAAAMIGELAEAMGTKLYRATIREGIAVKEAQISKMDIFTYAPKAKVTADFESFVKEVIQDEGI